MGQGWHKVTVPVVVPYTVTCIAYRVTLFHIHLVVDSWKITVVVENKLGAMYVKPCRTWQPFESCFSSSPPLGEIRPIFDDAFCMQAVDFQLSTHTGLGM